MKSAALRFLDVARTAGPLWAASLALDWIVPIGVLGLWPDRKTPVETLAAQVETILLAWGMSPEHAAITVEHLLYADRHGIDSHGCGMLLHYHRGLLDRSLTATPHIEVVRENETTALIDGGHGFGHVAADMAMKLAIEKCRAAGVGCVGVRNSSHFGAAGTYAAMASREGLIGIATTNTREPAVVPTRGVEAMLGTNPIAFAAPAVRNPTFLLDMATSTASIGKLNTAWRRGRTVPAGWALDPEGASVSHARLAARYRRLTPLGSSAVMGSHKGYGLATAVEILSAVLPGGDVVAPASQDASRLHPVGHFFLVIDPRRFREEGEFGADLDGLIDRLRSSTPLERRAPVFVAGDPERVARAERDRTGIPLSRSVVEDIRTVARAAGVPFLLDRRRRA